MEPDGPELAPYVEKFLTFERDWAPEWTASEMVVANPEHGYAGTLDYLISAAGRIGDALRASGYDVPVDGNLMGDTKTGGEWGRITSAGHVHGVYPEAGLQMSAYRRATVCWLRGGERVPMPPVAQVGVVLHLRPEGYRLYPARCGDLEYRYFRHAQMVDEWSSRIASAKADFAGGMDLGAIARMKTGAPDEAARGVFEGVMALHRLLRRGPGRRMRPRHRQIDRRGGGQPLGGRHERLGLVRVVGVLGLPQQRCDARQHPVVTHGANHLVRQELSDTLR